MKKTRPSIIIPVAVQAGAAFWLGAEDRECVEDATGVGDADWDTAGDGLAELPAQDVTTRMVRVRQNRRTVVNRLSAVTMPTNSRGRVTACRLRGTVPPQAHT